MSLEGPCYFPLRESNPHPHPEAFRTKPTLAAPNVPSPAAGACFPALSAARTLSGSPEPPAAASLLDHQHRCCLFQASLLTAWAGVGPLLQAPQHSLRAWPHAPTCLPAPGGALAAPVGQRACPPVRLSGPEAVGFKEKQKQPGEAHSCLILPQICFPKPFASSKAQDPSRGCEIAHRTPSLPLACRRPLPARPPGPWKSRTTAESRPFATNQRLTHSVQFLKPFLPWSWLISGPDALGIVKS